MNNKYIIVGVIMFVLFVILFNTKEKYVTYYDQRYCKACNEKSVLDCGTCNNCGICITNNDNQTVSKCVSGDKDGPSDAKCDTWVYGANINPVNNINNIPSVPYYYNYYYPFYNDMFYPPFYYDGLYNTGYNSTYNRRHYFKN